MKRFGWLATFALFGFMGLLLSTPCIAAVLITPAWIRDTSQQLQQSSYAPPPTSSVDWGRVGLSVVMLIGIAVVSLLFAGWLAKFKTVQEQSAHEHLVDGQREEGRRRSIATATQQNLDGVTGRRGQDQHKRQLLERNLK